MFWKLEEQVQVCAFVCHMPTRKPAWQMCEGLSLYQVPGIRATPLSSSRLQVALPAFSPRGWMASVSVQRLTCVFVAQPTPVSVLSGTVLMECL